jgi:hypothetical protein
MSLADREGTMEGRISALATEGLVLVVDLRTARERISALEAELTASHEQGLRAGLEMAAKAAQNSAANESDPMDYAGACRAENAIRSMINERGTKP